MIWNKEQKKVISSRGRNLLVSAAAGSGKTAVLAERVAQLAAQGTDLDSMLIITFTNAAAAEMKERIAKQVHIDYLTKCHICTFDKFAIEIYKNYYHVAGLKPGLRIIDSFKEAILKSEAMDELFEARFEADDPQFRAFLDRYAGVRSNAAAMDMVFNLHTFIQSMPDPDEWLEKLELGELFDIEVFRDQAVHICQGYLSAAGKLFEEAGRLLGVADGSGKPLMPGLAAKNAADIAELENIREILSVYGPEEAARALGSVKWNSLTATNAEKPAYELVKADIKKLRDAAKSPKGYTAKVKEILSGASAEALAFEKKELLPHIRTFCGLTREFTERYSKKKLAEGLMDFSDSTHFALRILQDPDVCKEFRDKFEYIFVDEYQDSNYIQEELVRRLSRGDNVFMVGDIKQSIYKFRLAEPEIFLNKYKEFRSGADPCSEAVDLNTNYRSKTPVIDCVNSVFRRVMTEDTVCMEYDEAAELHAGDDPYDGPLLYEPELYAVMTDIEEGDEVSEEIAELKAVELEARNAADIISKYYGRLIAEKTDTGVSERPLRYKDMAILLPVQKNKGEVFYQALTDKGIPVFLERGEGYFDTPEVQVFLDLLRVIDNPMQDVPLICVMHFPAEGFSADDLAQIRIFAKNRGAHASYYDALRLFAAEDTTELGDRARAFCGKLDEWRRRAACLPLADLIWELLHESGIAAFAQAMPGGPQRMANLRAMTDKAEVYETESFGGIGSFVSFIEHSIKAEKVDAGQIKLLTEADDVVRIMTIHKSKGLQFPFVLVAGLSTQLSGRGSNLPMALHKDLGASLKLVNLGTGLQARPLSMRIIEDRVKSETFAEKIRMMYVAMTRAKDILVLSGTVKSARDLDSRLSSAGIVSKEETKDYLSMVLPSIPAAGRHIVSRAGMSAEAQAGMPAQKIREGIERGFEIDAKAMPVSVEELEKRLIFECEQPPEESLRRKYSVSELAVLARLEAEGQAAEEAHPAPAKSEKPTGSGKPKGLTGAQKGTAYHTVMEHIPFTADDKTPENIAAFIQTLREKNILTEGEAAAVDPARVAAFFSSDTGRRAVAAAELRKEAPFIMKHTLGSREVLVQGVIDCYFREGDHYVLVDYKSNYVDASDPEGSKDRLRAVYEPQLALYKEALEGILGVPVKESVLYLFGLDDSVSIK